MAKTNPNKSTPPAKNNVDWDRVRQQIHKPNPQPAQHEKDIARLEKLANKVNR